MIMRMFLVFFIILAGSYEAFGGNLGFGIHSGYGVIKYEEQAFVSSGINREAESKQNAFLFGVSGEYSFCLKACSPQVNPPRRKNFYAGITTDWLTGLGDRETWRDSGIQFQTNDMRVFGQFYDLRFGYKNNFDRLYYRLYVSGGWDGLHFKRNNFVELGVAKSGTVTEDFSMWRAGAGLGLGYKLGKWALDGRAAYSYYLKGSVDNSSVPDVIFDTKGTCIDMGIGIAREIAQNMKIYAGFSYTLIELNESDIMWSNSTPFVFPDSTTEIMLGVASLTYAF